jgi:hypothetical protein
MNVNRVEFEKRNSGITWITFKASTGEIEVYPLTTRNVAALRDFLNDPTQQELIIRDNHPPKSEPANYCPDHGTYYNDLGDCPKCQESGQECTHFPGSGKCTRWNPVDEMVRRGQQRS